MSQATSLHKNTAWVFGGGLSSSVFKFAVGIILARILVPEDFGLLVTISVFTGVAGFIAGGGMGEALIQAKTVERKDYHVVFTLQLIICLLIYVFFFLIAPYFSIWFDDERYTTLLRVSALTFLLRPFVSIPKSYLRREMRFAPMIRAQLISLFVGSIASIVMAVYGMGVWALLFGGLIGTITNIIALYLTVRWIPLFAFEKEKAKRLGSYGFKMSVSDILVYIRNQAPNVFISRMFGPSMVGLYNKGDSLAAIPVELVAGSTYQTIFRALSKEQENLDKCKYLYLRTITLTTLYSLPIFIGLFWCAEAFIVTVYGDKWIESALPLQILCLAGMFRLLNSASGAILAAQNRLGLDIQIQIEAIIILIIGCFIGIEWGLTGIAISALICFSFLSIRMTTAAMKLIQLRFSDIRSALAAPVILNIVLLLGLVVNDMILNQVFDSLPDWLYLISTGTIGFLIYSLLFLFIPFETTKSESNRWRALVKLPVFKD